MRIVLKSERLAYVLVEPLPQPSIANVSKSIQKNLVDSAKAKLIILTSMSSKLQKQYKTVDACSIVRHLRELYNEQARTKRFKVSKLLFGSKMKEGTSLVRHALKMYEHIKRLNQLGYSMDCELSVDLIMASLPDSFAQFVLDYRMNYIVSTIPELINLLKTAMSSLRNETKHVMILPILRMRREVNPLRLK